MSWFGTKPPHPMGRIIQLMPMQYDLWAKWICEDGGAHYTRIYALGLCEAGQVVPLVHFSTGAMGTATNLKGFSRLQEYNPDTEDDDDDDESDDPEDDPDPAEKELIALHN